MIDEELINEFGHAVSDMFEQMIKGNWIDDQGHDVKMNITMINLKKVMEKAIENRHFKQVVKLMRENS